MSDRVAQRPVGLESVGPRWHTNSGADDRARASHAAKVLPPEFDAAFYRSAYVDLGALDSRALAHHWCSFGIAEGRAGSSAAMRSGFLALLDEQPSLLEIGPLANPIVSGPHVRYFDVVDTDELREKAHLLGLDPNGCPEIHYHDETANLRTIPDRFSAVVSSHAVEHQPDLVEHLQVVGELLHPGGFYFLAIPDKRYCFDHFLATSTIADVLGAHAQEARVHAAGDVINMMAMITHNDAMRHWDGDHGEPGFVQSPDALLRAIDAYASSNGGYLDTHAWQFTPGSFRSIVALLFDLGLQSLKPLRVYETIRGQLEFYAVLQLARP